MGPRHRDSESGSGKGNVVTGAHVRHRLKSLSLAVTLVPFSTGSEHVERLRSEYRGPRAPTRQSQPTHKERHAVITYSNPRDAATDKSSEETTVHPFRINVPE